MKRQEEDTEHPRPLWGLFRRESTRSVRVQPWGTARRDPAVLSGVSRPARLCHAPQRRASPAPPRRGRLDVVGAGRGVVRGFRLELRPGGRPCRRPEPVLGTPSSSAPSASLVSRLSSTARGPPAPCACLRLPLPASLRGGHGESAPACPPCRPEPKRGREPGPDFQLLSMPLHTQPPPHPPNCTKNS
ncbi:hypothetical protein ANANG_G00121240 [Anguilla anguilla]|uniref:Uncharacterized protein n=1 Tax=Anguilla anguilla TaxID=7936 RepID=A0A9D3MDH4_ANGAN|nr:hypothetical protein ANANG_G00121240 [Anguilla anguilla]